MARGRAPTMPLFSLAHRPLRVPPRMLWRGARRALLYAGLWWLLTGGAATSWIVGVPAAIAAAAASVALHPHSRWRLNPVGLARFIPHFLARSLVGSIDVAWRALHPGLPIAPAVIRYPLALPAGGPSRVFMAGAINLLPGTLCGVLDDDGMDVHVLNGASPSVAADIERLEERVAHLFDLPLPPIRR